MTDILELVRRITKIEQVLDGLIKPEVSRWRDWTPVVTQSVAVNSTIVFARYILQNSGVYLRAAITITSNGTAGNAISITGLPFAPLNAAGNTIGIIRILDSGTAYYVGSLDVSGSTLSGRAHGLGAQIGITPNFGLVNGDTISLAGFYEI